MFRMFIPIADYWMFIDNSKTPYEILAEGEPKEITIKNRIIWEQLKSLYNGK